MSAVTLPIIVARRAKGDWLSRQSVSLQSDWFAAQVPTLLPRAERFYSFFCVTMTKDACRSDRGEVNARKSTRFLRITCKQRTQGHPKSHTHTHTHTRTCCRSVSMRISSSTFSFAPWASFASHAASDAVVSASQSACVWNAPDRDQSFKPCQKMTPSRKKERSRALSCGKGKTD